MKGLRAHLCCVVLLISGSARASTHAETTLVVSGQFGTQHYAFAPGFSAGLFGSRSDTRSGSVSVPRFDPALGVLVGVSVSQGSQATASMAGVLTSPSSFTGVNANMTATYTLTAPGFSPLVCSTFFNQTVTVPNGQVNVGITYGLQSTNSGPAVIPQSAFAQYIGVAPMSMPLGMKFDQEVPVSNRSCNWQFSTDTQTSVSVEYRYVRVADLDVPSEDRSSRARVQILGNPGRGRLRFRINHNEAGPGRFTIVDAAGRLMMTRAGRQGDLSGSEIVWDGKTPSGRVAPSGLYYYRLESAEGPVLGRAVLMR